MHLHLLKDKKEQLTSCDAGPPRLTTRVCFYLLFHSHLSEVVHSLPCSAMLGVFSARSIKEAYCIVYRDSPLIIKTYLILVMLDI